MFQPFLKDQLSDRSDRFGLSCSKRGLTLAGVPLLSELGVGFQPRSSKEIRWLIGEAYQYAIDTSSLDAGLGSIAKSLNRGEITRAMISSVLLKLPELDWNGAVRIARAEDAILKFGYNPDQPRDGRGWWTSGQGNTGYSHHYAYQTLVCSHSAKNCSTATAWNGLLRNAYPGQDPMAGPIPPSGGDYHVFGEPNGPIHSSVDSENMTVKNEAQPGHIFYPGTVTRSVVDTPAGVSIKTEGSGTNSSIATWVENHAAGYWGFQGPDSNIRAYITNPGFYDKALRP